MIATRTILAHSEYKFAHKISERYQPYSRGPHFLNPSDWIKWNASIRRKEA